MSNRKEGRVVRKIHVPRRRKAGDRGRSAHLWYILVTAIVVIAALLVLQPWDASPRRPEAPPPGPKAPLAIVPSPPPPFRDTVYPTPQTDLLDRNARRVLQPTASGRPESGAYGSVRPGKFHEGIDIAATRRDWVGRPRDPVLAVARGTVGYVNRFPGNSNYGIYIVLIHDDPLGAVYTLYAHLAEVSTGLNIGQEVNAGTLLGKMGSTPVSIIPRARGHLHFEIGLIANSRFREWFLGKRLKPDHGLYNGWNLMGIDPLGFFAAHQRDPDVSFRDHLRSIPRAFEMVLATQKQLDFFQRYPQLWEGPEFSGGPIVIACSENGVPLEGRNASEEEKTSLAGSKAFVLKADAAVLGANGYHLVERNRKEGWVPGSHAQLWLDILAY